MMSKEMSVETPGGTTRSMLHWRARTHRAQHRLSLHQHDCALGWRTWKLLGVDNLVDSSKR